MIWTEREAWDLAREGVVLLVALVLVARGWRHRSPAVGFVASAILLQHGLELFAGSPAFFPRPIVLVGGAILVAWGIRLPDALVFLSGVYSLLSKLPRAGFEGPAVELMIALVALGLCGMLWPRLRSRLDRARQARGRSERPRLEHRDRCSIGRHVGWNRLLNRSVVGAEAHREPIRRKRAEALEVVSTGPIQQPEHELACRRMEDEQVRGAIAIVVR
jgi:hypothetical protein